MTTKKLLSDGKTTTADSTKQTKAKSPSNSKKTDGGSMAKKQTNLKSPSDSKQITMQSAKSPSTSKIAEDSKASKQSKAIAGEKKPPEIPREPLPMTKYPKGAFFCLGNEVAERFSFYGLKAILVIYLITIYKMKDHEATFCYHLFVSIAYFTPLVGSCLADGALGVFRVIIIISTIYCLGHVLLMVGTMPQLNEKDVKYFDLAGLCVIAFGIGGIKPCVSVFTADQFPLTMTIERRRFGSFFYCSVTLAALIAEFLIPGISHTKCFDKDTCYPVSFGFLAAFVFIAFVIFLCGTKFYSRPKYKDTRMCQVVSCVCYALSKNYCCCRKNWLEVATEKYGAQLVTDVKSLCHIFLLFIPSIFFWALFDQQGSTWVTQASNMDGHFFGFFNMYPDQISLLNPLFMLILVPLFVYIIYPIVWKYDCLVRPLRRMGYGCFLATLSFVAAGIIQFLLINPTLVQQPQAGYYRYAIINFRQCNLSVSFADEQVKNTTVLTNNSVFGDFPQIAEFQEETPLANWTTAPNVTKGYGQVFIFFSGDFLYLEINFKLIKTPNGQSIVHVAFHPDLAEYNITVFFLQSSDKEDSALSVTSNATEPIKITPSILSSAQYDVYLKKCSADHICTKTTLLNKIKLLNGGVYCLAIENEENFQFFTLIYANNVTMAWMIPQYFLITVGEIMFAMSGSEFSGGQAARSMRTTVQACWLTTKGFGNVIAMLVSGTPLIENAAYEYFFYAVLMFFFLLVFIYYAYDYEYIDRQAMELERQKQDEEKTKKATIDFISKLESKKVESKPKQPKQVFTNFIE